MHNPPEASAPWCLVVIISCVCSPTTTAVTVSVLVSGVVSAISTAIVTSIIVWCVMRRPPSPAGTGTADDDKGVTELTTVHTSRYQRTQ